MGENAVDISALYGHWVHSSEEDTAEETVFRPPDYNFPPSRGRDAFKLGRDNSFVSAGTGATDVSKVSAGRWRTDNRDGIKIFVEFGSNQEVIEVISVDKGQLKIRKKNVP